MAMEYRYMRRASPSVTDDGKLTGRAWPYGKATQIGSGPYGFREKIRRGAGKKSINDGDIVLLDNHETRLPLARMSAGTLTMRDGGDGGDWEATPADTTYAQDVVKNVRAKNYGGCSFGFEVVKDIWTMDDGSPATPMTGTQREIVEMKVHEISVCTFPAYGDTMVSTKAQVRAARGLSPEQERKVSATAYNSGEGEDHRAAAATYSDLSTCGDCGAENQYGAYCTGCGEPMTTPKSSGDYCASCGAKMDNGTRACGKCGEVRSENTRGGDAPGDGSKPYGDVTYADPGYQSDKKKRYPIDTKKHAKAAWAYISKAKNAAAYTASQLASIKSKIKAALSSFGVKMADETKMADWEALCDFREMTEGWEEGDMGVLPGDVTRVDDINILARDIKDAKDTSTRLALIERATNFGVGGMLPDHWDGTGGIGSVATNEVTRDMDEIYSLAMSMPPTKVALRIMDLAQAYLAETAEGLAERAKEEPAPEEEEFTPLTRAEAMERLAQAEERRKALYG